MKRRDFLSLLGAAGIAPVLPLPAGAAPVAAGYNRYMYGLAVFHARTRASVTAADLVARLRVNAVTAEAIMGEMSAKGVVAPALNAAGGVMRTIDPHHMPGDRAVRDAARRAADWIVDKAPDAPEDNEITDMEAPERGRRTKMEKFEKLTGIAAPMPLINVDTDMIIPKQFLKTIKRSGLGVNLFDEMRYDDDGKEIADFVLNKPQYREAEILVAGDNFGCGSSREHAPWAIKDFGIRCVIAPSFADIFFNNCFKNGILPIVLPQDQVDVLMKDAEKGANARVTVDLESQTVTTSDGEVFSFEVDAFKKHCLLEGLDDIGLTMEKASSIDAFEMQAATQRPWV